MEKTTKTLFSLVLCLSLTALSSGCKKKEEGNSSTTSENSSSTSTPAAPTAENSTPEKVAAAPSTTSSADAGKLVQQARNTMSLKNNSYYDL